MAKTLRLFVAVGLVGLAAAAFSDDKKKEGAKDEAKTEKTKIGIVTYEVPTSWTKQAPRSSMRLAQYELPLADGDSGPAILIVFSFGPGQGGDFENNAKRWKAMIKGKDEGTTETFDANNDMKVSLVDKSGTFVDATPGAPGGVERENYRLMAAMVETNKPQGNYFFRFVGPKKTIDAQAEGFKKMLKSAKLE